MDPDDSRPIRSRLSLMESNHRRLYAFSTIRTRLFAMLFPLCSAIYQCALAPPSPTPNRLSTGKGVANSPYQATNWTLDLGNKSTNQTPTAALDSRNLFKLLSPLSPTLRLDSCTSYHASQTWFRPSNPKPKPIPTPLTCHLPTCPPLCPPPPPQNLVSPIESLTCISSVSLSSSTIIKRYQQSVRRIPTYLPNTITLLPYSSALHPTSWLVPWPPFLSLSPLIDRSITVTSRSHPTHPIPSRPVLFLFVMCDV